MCMKVPFNCILKNHHLPKTDLNKYNYFSDASVLRTRIRNVNGNIYIYRNNWNSRQVASTTPRDNAGFCFSRRRQWTIQHNCLLFITYFCFISVSIAMSLIFIVLLALSPLTSLPNAAKRIYSYAA